MVSLDTSSAHASAAAPSPTVRPLRASCVPVMPGVAEGVPDPPLTPRAAGLCLSSPCVIPKVPVAARLVKQNPCLANSRATRSLHLNPPQATFSAMAKKGKKAAPEDAEDVEMGLWAACAC